MFIINTKQNTINYTKDFILYKKVSGNFNIISEAISKRYEKVTLEKEGFINYIKINGISELCNYTIFDTTRKIKFHIYLKVLSEKDILLYLFGYNKELISNIESYKSYNLYGKLPLNFKNFSDKYIKTENDLIKNSLYFYKKKELLGYNICYLQFSHILGNYNIGNYINNAVKGVDRNKITSRNKSISEFIERVSCSFYGKLTKYNRECNINRKIIYNYIEKEDYQLNMENVFFSRIKNIFTKNNTYICSDILFYPYKTNFKTLSSNSNGVATHITRKKSIEGGLYELIERDCFVLMWLLKINFYKISIKSVNLKEAKIINELIKNYNIEIFIYIIKFDNPIPVCFIIGKKQNKVITSLGIGENLELSINKALEELLGMVYLFNENKTNLEKIVKKDYIFYHIYYYLFNNKIGNLSWLLESNEYSFKDIDLKFHNYTFNKLLKYYFNLGINFYSYKYINKLSQTFNRYTTRVLSDKLFPIYFGKTIPKQILNSNRLKKIVIKNKIKSINNNLHPFG